MTIEEFKECVNHKGNKYRNTRIVKVKELRTCRHCNKPIFAKSECLTTNNQGHGRKWICMDCLQALLDYLDALERQASVAFGDEGAEWAMQDWVKDCKQVLYDRHIMIEEEPCDYF